MLVGARKLIANFEIGKVSAQTPSPTEQLIELNLQRPLTAA